MTERQKIERFILIAERIKNSRFFTNTKNVSLHLNFEDRIGTSQKISGADEEDMRSMLIDIRKITLEKDGVNFLDICDLLINTTTSDETAKKINEWKDAYTKFLENPPVIPFSVNGKVDTAWETIEKWLYGHYFHEHENHQTFLRDLDFGAPIYKYNFTVSITTLSGFCFAISQVAQSILNEKNL